MKRRALVSLAAVAALLLSAGRALAEEDPGLRVRIGTSLAAGALIVPGFITTGYVGNEFQVGAQFNNVVALYLAPALHYAIGGWGGANASAALMLDFTFLDTVSVSIGPEIDNFGASSDHPSPQLPGASGLVQGGMFQFAVCPGFLRRWRDGHREGITFGAEIHGWRSSTRFFDAPRNSPPRTLLTPVLTVGIQTF